jgi:succinate dehydrogenase/fumarate reductase flavoprotein subunit
MKTNINPVEKARLELLHEQDNAKQAQAAVRDFCGPFEEKELSIKSEISDEQRRLNSLRQDLSKVLDDSVKAEEIEAQIEKREQLLKRLAQRLDLSQDWRKREADTLGKLQEQEQSADFACQAAYERYTTAWRDYVFRARENYLNSLKEYWAEAASKVSEVQFPKFAWKDLEITDLDIRKHAGAIKW